MATLLGSSDGDNAWATRPWKRELGPGIFVTPRRDVWVYRVLPLAPLEWEDPARRLQVQGRLDRLLVELGETSRDLGQGVRTLAQTRAIHLVSVLFEKPTVLPDGISSSLREFQTRMSFAMTTEKGLFIGVKLRRDAVGQLTSSQSDESLLSRAKAAMKATANTPQNLDLFARDFDRVNATLARAGCTEPTPEQLSQLTSWVNDGNGLDTVIAAGATKLKTPSGTTWQVSALMGVDDRYMSMSSPNSPWLMDAMNHPAGAQVVSIRSELEPSTVTRGRLRRAQRTLRAQEEEERATGDIARDEIGEKAGAARDVENYTRAAGHAWLSQTSVLFARKLFEPEPDETFADLLGSFYGFDIKPLEKRQLRALSEMLPGSDTRVNPFSQDVNPAWVAYSGAQAFSEIGDNSGLLLGSCDPHWTPVRVDVFAAANTNKPPIMGIFGEPGSGKTFAAQLLTSQAALGGQTAIFINPKGFDSLRPFAEWVADQGAPSRVVSMQAVEAGGGGEFDPFRFTEPKMAAEILARHINTVLGVSYAGGLTGKQETELGRGLSEGANAGALCAFEALEYVRDKDIVEQVLGMVEASTLFALAFSKTPREPFGASSGLTLIEFDREMPLPTPGKNAAAYERDERIAVAALRLVSRASLEILMRSGGGVLVVDEAHHFLGSTEGMATLDRIGREGRSLGLLPIFATQRVTDLLKVDLESFMSRVLTMKLTDRDEASAALNLCRLDATEERLSLLRSARPGTGFFRDMEDRHGLMMVGAGVPEDLRMAMSTNREDRQRRAQESLES